ncbi:indolepyruvate ferredoxin oxidoreductase family protein [Novosphingobium decolorationis]|uniref:Indolepyruvate ferredoxin oxidoreductase family protein n=1 Tax=Novosphingobium decolorationis TaxID=2698673 RepID=A0ABX8E7A4_9SPHN|nr:indolepyruvate ferredoxin oxidoreductase family protein [Novosphingobium decolorationis]QVM84688.1 indolepyruvate ferredoxin oxidoreductase family protein [Novosphingobium decolorationis]
MTKSVTTLTDKYVEESGRIQIGALQAYVRLLLDQARRDRAEGVASAGYVTGYRGSPVTTLDAQLWGAGELLAEHDIRFEPGLNEELAATSLRGTQQLGWFGTPRVEGVFALWYAKGIGVDRAHEALKLGNLEGAAHRGGVLLLAGDDHAAKSSASAHQSDQNLAAAFVPTLYPATNAEILSYGQYGWALSRYSGLYCGMKAVTDTLDLTASVDLPGWTFPIHTPNAPGPARNLREGMSALEQEALTVRHRLPAAQAFVRANLLDRVTHGRADTRGGLVIVTAGKAWLDTAQALLALGLDAGRCRELGITVLKLALTWPVDPEIVKQVCTPAREVLVIEEKRGWIEDQIARILYGVAPAPALSGKTDPQGRPLLRAEGVLDPSEVRAGLVRRLRDLGCSDPPLDARAEALEAADGRAQGLSMVAARPAYFCSGCPHNRSTQVPEGSSAMGATGCHGLAHYMPGRHTMQTVGMGSEGTPWIAAQHFVDTPHYFQNLGDGTYTHSGLLAIRASVAAKSAVTYKILYNDAVAMTGGQPMEGGLTPQQIVRELVTEGVDPVVVVSEAPEIFAREGLPGKVRVLHRDELERVQRDLREVKGTSAILYEQTCANEKRRRRKRGQLADPDRRLFINAAVCEGCGDCSVQSNCLSIEPVDTQWGRKRRINQSTCNKDFSCIKGFCPSFVTVEGGRPARRMADLAALEGDLAALPEPARVSCAQGFDMLVTGIGGTGVLTVGAVLAMAAQIEGKAASLLDMTGMAQKGGAVVSHLRIAPEPAQIPCARVGTEQADVILACDLVVASAPDVRRAQGPGTTLVANEDVAPTAEFQTNSGLDLSAARFLSALGQRGDPARAFAVHAGELASALLGDAIFTNFLMVGYAAQKGLLPVSLAAIEEALALNGTAVAANHKALALGRLAAHDPGCLERLAGLADTGGVEPETLEGVLDRSAAHLEDYQDAAYARAYREQMANLRAAISPEAGDVGDRFLRTAARQLARLMAYKDEYEVARLYTRPEFARSVNTAFDGDVRIALNLAPPFLPLGRDRKTGRPRKIRFGAWIFPPLRLLARGKRLRGGPFDPFGYSAERRAERALVQEYGALLHELAQGLSAQNAARAIEIAQSVSQVRGYGPVKEESMAAWRALVARELPEFRDRASDACAPGEAIGEVIA